jgi:hypothetical protein
MPANGSRVATTPIVVQRKCGCTASLGGCAECRGRASPEREAVASIQRSLTIGRAGDAYEREADAVADRVVGRGTASITRLSPPAIRKAAVSGGGEHVPSSVQHEIHASRGGGAPLSAALRTDLEPRFGYDFSNVRVHTDGRAASLARALGARAFTVGSDIMFGAGSFRTETPEGKRLLAHELTHVVQQGGDVKTAAPASLPIGHHASAYVAREEVDAGDQPDLADMGSTASDMGSPPVPVAPRWRSGTICHRPSRRNMDYPNTYVELVTVDLSVMKLTIRWNNPAPGLPIGPWGISPGVGKCNFHGACADCNDPAVSTRRGSLCTPKGGPWPVTGIGCVLSDANWAISPTFFQRPGIAIHGHKDGNDLGAAHSHGCTRNDNEGAMIIHDNARFGQTYAANPGRQIAEGRTHVQVDGTWSSSICYTSASDNVGRPRSTECVERDTGTGTRRGGGAHDEPHHRRHRERPRHKTGEMMTPEAESEIVASAELPAEDLDARDGP